MDMTTRQQMTNVAAPTGTQAQMGRLVKMQTYRDVSYQAGTAPHAETLYTTAWIDVSREPWILSVLDMVIVITCCPRWMPGRMSSKSRENRQRDRSARLETGVLFPAVAYPIASKGDGRVPKGVVAGSHVDGQHVKKNRSECDQEISGQKVPNMCQSRPPWRTS